MLEHFSAFQANTAQYPQYLQIWLNWLVAINLASVLFIFHKPQARWVLLAMIGNVAFMMFLFSQVGFVRLLGLSHIIFWTPLLIYLAMRKGTLNVTSISGIYFIVVFVSNLASLVLDYYDVYRYIMGEREPLF